MLLLGFRGPTQLQSALPRISAPARSPSMFLLLLVGLGWVSLRTALLLSQVSRHSSEARLGRSFQQELRNRGLLDASLLR